MRNEKYYSFKRINQLHPKIQAKAKEFIIRADKELGIKLKISSGYRSDAEQDKLYAVGRNTPGKIITYAKGGESTHNKRLAFDVVEIKNGKAIWNNPNWGKIEKLGKSLGFSWDGDWTSFKDKPHFEMKVNFNRLQLCPERGSNPHVLRTHDPQSCLSTNSSTWA